MGTVAKALEKAGHKPGTDKTISPRNHTVVLTKLNGKKIIEGMIDTETRVSSLHSLFSTTILATGADKIHLSIDANNYPEEYFLRAAGR